MKKYPNNSKYIMHLEDSMCSYVAGCLLAYQKQDQGSIFSTTKKNQ